MKINIPAISNKSKKYFGLVSISGTALVLALSLSFANSSSASSESKSLSAVLPTPSSHQTAQPVSPTPIATPTPTPTSDDEPFFEDKPRPHHTSPASTPLGDFLFKGLVGSDGSTFERDGQICASGDYQVRCWNPVTKTISDMFIDQVPINSTN